MAAATTTRFSSAYATTELLDLVAEVARVAKPSAPEMVTEREWDGARAAAGHEKAPSARAICLRLRVGWARVREAALANGRSRRQAIAAWTSRPDREKVSREDAVAALQLVARRRGAKTRKPHTYREERSKLEAERRRQRRHDGSRPSLPDEEEIPRVFKGGWAEALEAAGLEQPSKPKRVPASESWYEVLGQCIDEFGTLPTSRELELYARARRLLLSHAPERYELVVAEVRRRREAQGLEMPTARPPKAQRPDYSAQPADVLPADEWTMRGRSWTAEQKRAAVTEFVTWADEQGRTTSRLAFLDFRRDFGKGPWARAFQPGELTRLVAEVRQEKRHGK